MSHQSTPQFRTFHALRVKGFANVELLAEMTALDLSDVGVHLDGLAQRELVRFRDARAVWQLTPEGKSAHAEQLVADIRDAPIDALAATYAVFLDLNDEFKVLCGGWQLRDGRPNDHLDAGYDRAAIDALAGLHQRVEPAVAELGDLLARLEPYGPRLDAAIAGLRAGDTTMFTGVMCGSYHDIWMELHEDLLLTQRIDRAAEGSF